MPNEVLLKSRDTITAQTSGAAFPVDIDPTSASYTADEPTVIDNTYDAGTENSKGADNLQLLLHIATAPGTAATSEIWYSISEDGSNYSYWKYSHTVGDTIATDSAGLIYDAGIFVLSAQYTKLAVAAVDDDFVGTLLAYPKLYEIQ